MFTGKVGAALLLLSLAAGGVRAQSLADAAAKAEEQRKATGKATKAYNDETLIQHEGYESLVADRYLLEPHWPSYSAARAYIAGARVQSMKLDAVLMKQELAGDRYGLEKAFRSDPVAKDILSMFDLSARYYFMADASLELAGADMQQGFHIRNELTESRRANVDFVRDHGFYPPYYPKAPWNAMENILRNSRRTGQ